MLKILFIHGLASSGAYKTADTLRILLRPCEVISPDVPIDPGQALEMLQDICLKEQPDTIVGLSLGGFWAQKLRGIRKILINPDFHISKLMAGMIGQVRYLSPRRDGAEYFNITPEICEGYAALEQIQFDNLDQHERTLTFGMFADHDTLVNCRAEFERHYPSNSTVYPGEHLPTYPQIKKYLVPKYFSDYLCKQQNDINLYKPI